MKARSESPLTPASVLEMLDATLLHMSKKQSKASEEVQIFYDDEFEAVGAVDSDEFRYLLRVLVDRDLLSVRGQIHPSRANQFFRMTPEGWQKVDQLTRARSESDKAFVAMSFEQSLLPVYKDGIEPALVSTGFRPFRVDMHEHDEKIDDVILAAIRTSGLVVADFTGNNSGVYFETGFAMGLGVHVVRTCREDEIGTVHFDVNHYSHILWTSPTQLKDRLATHITAVGLARG